MATLAVVRTIAWDDGAVVLIDQTALPHEVRRLRITDVPALVDAIQRLVVRGAPALGVAGAFGVALAARAAAGSPDAAARVRAAAAQLRAARPTAVNLAWGVDQVLAAAADGADAALAAALALADADVTTNRALGEHGAAWLFEQLSGPPRTLLTHCNAGGLACVEWGTALGIVRAAHERQPLERVYATETRPLLQGARLTAFELAELGIPHRLVVDSAAPAVIAGRGVQAVVVGADRVAANGDVANKIGTYGLALAAADAGIPFVVAAPSSTLDLSTPEGAAIPIEERDQAEVTALGGVRTAAAGTPAYNPAFDITPARLVTAIITEHGVWRAAGPSRDRRPPG